MKQPIKLAEEVAPNLVPMVDIMFLLLLFFMLSADMGQRQLEAVKLPKADSASDDTKATKEKKRVVVNVHHRPALRCAAYDAGEACRERGHWDIAIGGRSYLLPGARAEFERDLGKDADVAIMVRADAAAPFGMAQQVMNVCAHAGLYKVEVGAAMPLAKR